MQQWLASRIFYGWVIVGAGLAINALSSTLNPVVFSFMIGPMSEDLGVAKSALALAFTLRLVAAGFSGPVIGVLIDRHGARWIGVVSGTLVGTMLILLAMSHQIWVVYLVFAISGLAGLGGPAGQLLTQVPIAKWFVTRRGRALSIATMGMAGGTVLAVPITQFLVEAFGWRSTSVIYGIAVLAVVPTVSGLFVRRSPEDMGLHPDGLDHPPAEDGATNASVGIATTDEWTVKEALRTPAMWLLLAALGLAGTALTGTLVYRVDYWSSLGMSPALVGFGTMLDPLTVVFSVFIMGMVADRVPVRFLGFAGLAVFALSVLPMIYSSGEGYTIILHNVVWGTGAGGYITLNNLVWPNYYGRRYLGAIRGIVLPVSIAASGTGAPLYGFLLDSGLDPRHVWTIATVSFAVASVLILAARPPRRSSLVPGPEVAVRAEPGDPV